MKVHYTGTFDNGEVFDSSEGGQPLEFTVGTNQVIPGFEDAVVGMAIGDKKTVVIPPDQAYGERMPELVHTVNRQQFNLGDSEPEIGMAIEMHTPDGTIPLVIADLSDTTVTLDANHPLAGQTLHFELTLMEVG